MTPQTQRLRLRVLPGRLAVCRLPGEADIPSWAGGSELMSITRTRHELSIVCAEERVPAGTQCEREYAALGVEGTLAPELVGVLVSLATPLAEAGIPILAIGTFDTDYILVREAHLSRAIAAVERAGHQVSTD